MLFRAKLDIHLATQQQWEMYLNKDCSTGEKGLLPPFLFPRHSALGKQSMEELKLQCGCPKLKWAFTAWGIKFFTPDIWLGWKATWVRTSIGLIAKHIVHWHLFVSYHCHHTRGVHSA